DFLFAFEGRGGDLVGGDVAGRGGGDVHAQVAHQRLEIVGASHEVGLAVDLDHHADLAPGVDVGTDQPVLGRAAGLLGGGREPLGAQQFDRFVHVALGLGEGLLAFHHAHAG